MAFKRWAKTDMRLADGAIVEGIAPVIVSASRSTDIPAFYPEWLMNRLRAGYVKWINPFNQQPQYVSFERTRLVVFWTKNAEPLIPYLGELDERGINYYFQFTLNDYGAEGLEPRVAPLPRRLDTFKRLSERLGKERVIWRFDPLILAQDLDVDLLLEKVQGVGDKISQYTEKLVVSFADIEGYKKVQNTLRREAVPWREFTEEKMREFARGLEPIAKRWGLEVATCAEAAGLEEFGIKHNRCIDDELMVRVFRDDARLMGFLGVEDDLFEERKQPSMKDKGQRKECGCIVSKDIGMYNTCAHMCVYCYANTSENMVSANRDRHDPTGDAIVGT